MLFTDGGGSCVLSDEKHESRKQQENTVLDLPFSDKQEDILDIESDKERTGGLETKQHPHDEPGISK